MSNNPTDSIDADTLRKCRKCGEAKPDALFFTRLSQSVNHNHRMITSVCRDCTAKQFQEIYQANKEKKKAQYLRRYAVKGKADEARIKEVHPEKPAARIAARHAVKAGKLIKAACQNCSDVKTEFHHTNGYDKPNWLVGIWLCRQCHAILHRELRERKLHDVSTLQ